MQEFYILTLNPRLREVFQYIEAHEFRYEVHLNRTRFWVPEGRELTEFSLRFADVCPRVDPSLDVITGRPKSNL